MWPIACARGLMVHLRGRLTAFAADRMRRAANSRIEPEGQSMRRHQREAGNAWRERVGRTVDVGNGARGRRERTGRTCLPDRLEEI